MAPTPSPAPRRDRIVDLTSAETKLLLDGYCPDCGEEDNFLHGPRGGMSVNIECARCRARFNFSGLPGANQRIREATKVVEPIPRSIKTKDRNTKTYTNVWAVLLGVLIGLLGLLVLWLV